MTETTTAPALAAVRRAAAACRRHADTWTRHLPDLPVEITIRGESRANRAIAACLNDVNNLLAAAALLAVAKIASGFMRPGTIAGCTELAVMIVAYLLIRRLAVVRTLVVPAAAEGQA